LEPPGELITCHRDLWADNVRATPGGSLAVIDWENGGLADPSQELALVLFEYADGDPRRARALVGAYRDAGGPGRIVGRGTFSMTIAQLGHIAEWALERWLEAEGAAERERLEALVGEVLGRPLTIDAIDRLVEAVAS
jgi:aminoglycoside phosphotransferase (APT) family kinase protein